ncbi:uncharacterized protein EKO05_0005924 [Ascochyta rabiei]|uniref:Uncharacterized protein n=1 Tax=Didymella rabiei TaxID=5454 RepID=A0A163JL23_DIDRA|nr:uncharacterized protein EKO05_0005924 [Ascochyta rabiei]KZM26431.1 hypothetical protein ST47_g2419 [Ascochyta rabiei]UPX15478.1 hypothetical protein EKO05_0005924 [Ascochyta rabiei]
MDASTRLYARLGEIPEDPNDPESLDDLIVCAFGAFERYYLCWKTRSGEFRQDGYDLPLALNDWLNPTDGTARDWASLQVVFGRGEEYFASDKNGKLEYKEPEVKKQAEEEGKEKSDRQALRRSRTVSFLRPLSQASNRSDGPAADQPANNRRTSSISSHRASRPPSLSYSTTGSEASTAPPISNESQSTVPIAETSFVSRFTSLGSGTGPTAVTSTPAAELNALIAIPTSTSSTTATQDAPSFSNPPQLSNKNANRSGITSIPEERFTHKIKSIDTTPEACTCGCHDPPIPSVRQSTYANASVQTDPTSPAPRSALRVDTSSASRWSNNNYSAVSHDLQTPIFDSCSPAIPFSMGRMTNYFSKPGYQLGDSLASGYQYCEQPMYQYQDAFGDEALR